MGFDIPKHKPAFAKDILGKIYEINDKDKAAATLGQLSCAQNHTPMVAEVFDHIIAKQQYEIVRGIFLPLKGDDLLGLDLPQNFKNVWAASTNKANSDIDTFIEFLHNADKDTPGRTIHVITQASVLSRINKIIAGYEQAFRHIIPFGFTKDELMEISNLAAWDLGQCGYVARLAACAGYISEDIAWQYMIAASSTAHNSYPTWRKFLAAFFIGRAMAHTTDDISGFADTAHFLLKDSKSPYTLFPLND